MDYWGCDILPRFIRSLGDECNEVPSMGLSAGGIGLYVVMLKPNLDMGTIYVLMAGSQRTI